MKKDLALVSAWNELVYLEEKLIDRLKSFFLVRWFGQNFPVSSGNLKIGIVNIDALRRRYEQMKKIAESYRSGINLTEPLAGMAGTVAGIIFSPTGWSIVGVIKGTYNQVGTMGTVLLAIGNFILGFVTSGIGLAAGTLGIGLGFPLAIIGSSIEMVRDFYTFFGALARMLKALGIFIYQLLGPRHKVRNPLVRAVLAFLDKIAALFPFLSAFIAVVVVHGGKAIHKLARELPQFAGLFTAAGKLLSYLFSSFIEQLKTAFMGTGEKLSLLNAFTRALKPLKNMFKVFKEQFISLFTLLKDWFVQLGEKIKKELSVWWEKTKPILLKYTKDHPLIKMIQQLIKGIKLMIKLLKVESKAPSPPPAAAVRKKGASLPLFPPPLLVPPFQTPGDMLIRYILKKLFGKSSPSGKVPVKKKPKKTHPITKEYEKLLKSYERLKSGASALPLKSYKHIPSIADFLAFLRKEGIIADPFKPTQEIAASLKKARTYRSIFAAEWHALRDKEGRSVQEQLDKLRAEELGLRDTLAVMIQRLMPAVAGSRVKELEPVFQKLDEYIYNTSGAKPWQAPVLQLPANNRLHPVVKEIQIVVEGEKEFVKKAGDWKPMLQKAFKAQTYEVTGS